MKKKLIMQQKYWLVNGVIIAGAFAWLVKDFITAKTLYLISSTGIKENYEYVKVFLSVYFAVTGIMIWTYIYEKMIKDPSMDNGEESDNDIVKI